MGESGRWEGDLHGDEHGNHAGAVRAKLAAHVICRPAGGRKWTKRESVRASNPETPTTRSGHSRAPEGASIHTQSQKPPAIYSTPRTPC